MFHLQSDMLYHFILILFSDTTIIQRKKKITHVSFLKGTSFTRVHGIPFYVTERCENLPDEALKYYKVATKKQLKSRLSVKFGKLKQTPLSSIANESIRYGNKVYIFYIKMPFLYILQQKKQ